jgi:S1-C subfamily serine protease
VRPAGRVALLAVLVGSAFGCGDSNDPTSVPVVDIRANGCGPRARLGVGTAIDDGLVVTAAHVVAGADQVMVTGRDGSSGHATIVFLDGDLDVAALRVDLDLGDPLDLRTEPVVADTPASVTLPARGDRDAATTGVDIIRPVNIRTTDIYLDDDVERHGFEVAATVEPGDSGAMVVVDGRGAGIIWARSTAAEDRAWAVDLPENLLDPARRAALTDEIEPAACP